MKLIKYTFAVLAAMSLATSCSDKGYYDEYTPDGVEYSFEQSQYNTLWPQIPETFTLNVFRSTTAGDVSIPLQLDTKYTDEIHIPPTVEFVDGSNTASITVAVNDFEVNTEYAATITLVGVDASPSGKTVCEMSLNLDYNWVSLGTGAFIDRHWMDDIYEVEILKAEGFPIYRVLEPYTEWAKSDQVDADLVSWLAGPYPEKIEFWEVVSGGDVLLNWKPYSCGLNYQGVDGQSIGVYPPYYLGRSMANCCWYIDQGIAALSPYYYITNLGGWDDSGVFGTILIALPDYVDQL